VSMVLRRAMIVLTVIGLGVATYLTVVHYVGFQALACVGGHAGHSSCQTVQSSTWSKLAGVPVALIGLVGYVFILGSLLIPDREESRLATLGLTLIGFGFSGYLTYRELYYALPPRGASPDPSSPGSGRVRQRHLARGADRGPGARAAPGLSAPRPESLSRPPATP